MRNPSVAIVGGAALALAAFTSARADILVATAGPLTGELASFGEQMKRGAEKAVADINAKGGVLGQKLKLELGDDQCDPKQAVAVANKFASEGIKFVAGHFCSGSSIPASAVYHEENIVQMTPASTNPKLTEDAAAAGWKNVFRSCGRDDVQGVVAGKYIAMTYKGKKVAILDDKSAYGAGIARYTEKTMRANGLDPAIVDQYNAGEKDYSALVGKLKAAGIDVIYIGGYHPEGGLITRQAREQGLNAQIIGEDAFVTDEFWKITGPAGEGVLMTFPPDARNFPEAAKVVAEFKNDNYDPEGYTLYTYAAYQIWSQAVTKAKAVDNTKIEAELHGHTFETVLGKITLDDKGDVKDPKYVFYIWHEGKYAEMK